MCSFLLAVVALVATPLPTVAFAPLTNSWSRVEARSYRLTPLGLSTADFKNGLTILDDNKQPVKIMEFLHVKPGKGSAFVRTKLKNLITGNTNEKTWRAGESVEIADVQKEDVQYSYQEGDEFVFMDTNTFETMNVPSSAMGNAANYMTEGLELTVIKFDNKVIDVQIPNSMVLEVTQTDTGLKGNTAKGGGTKPATLETGLELLVPLFIDTGEKIKVNTEDNSYVGRSNEK